MDQVDFSQEDHVAGCMDLEVGQCQCNSGNMVEDLKGGGFGAFFL